MEQNETGEDMAKAQPVAKVVARLQTKRTCHSR
jgi:hypothetical protein